MALTLTKEQLDAALRYVVRKLQDDKVNISNVGKVIEWMILNPLPTRETLEEENRVEEEAERQRRITLLTEELVKLEGK